MHPGRDANKKAYSLRIVDAKMLDTVHGIQIVTAFGKQLPATRSLEAPIPRGLKGMTMSSGEPELAKGLGYR